MGLAWLVTSLGLNLPGSLAELASPDYWQLPGELLLAGALVILMGRRLAWPLATLIAVLILVRVVDRLVWLWFGRELVLATDLELAVPLLEVASGGWRWLPLAMALAVLSAVIGLLAWPIAAGLGQLAGLPRWTTLVPLALLALTPLGAISGQGAAQAWVQAERYRDAANAEAAWLTARARDRSGELADQDLFAVLADTDVLVVFVESYGRSALDDPALAPLTAPGLDRLATAAAGSGLAMVSGWASSPTVGGQSWLAHATLASGIETRDQGGWRTYLRESDADLAHLFRRAGHATVMVQPAIVHPFPEAAGLGFDRLLFADDLGYRGERQGYVTMPDQFTLARVDALLADPARSRPVYGQVVLVGSHAPFTPLPPPLLPWEQVGDGQGFATDMNALTPAALWADPAALERAYGETMARTLDVLAGWLARPRARSSLILVLGDHEPAARVLGHAPTHDVPLHVLANDPRLLTPFQALGFVAGARPDPGMAPVPMAALRAVMLDGYGKSPASRHTPSS